MSHWGGLGVFNNNSNNNSEPPPTPLYNLYHTKTYIYILNTKKTNCYERGESEFFFPGPTLVIKIIVLEVENSKGVAFTLPLPPFFIHILFLRAQAKLL